MRKPTSGGTAITADATDPMTRTQALKDFPPAIYAVRLHDGLVKIGWSRSLANRLGSYGKDSELLGLMPGTLADEKQLHARLAPHRARLREYYHPAPEVLAEVNTLREWSGLPAM